MHTEEPGNKVQPTPLGPAAAGVAPWAVRRPQHALGGVYGGSKKRRPPCRLPRPRIQQQFPGRAVRRHGLAPVGEMAWWVERVAPVWVSGAAHHRQRKTRSRLARTIVIHEQRAPLRPWGPCPGQDAARRKYRSKPPILVCLIRRRYEKRLARISAPCHIFSCGVVASVAASTRTRPSQ